MKVLTVSVLALSILAAAPPSGASPAERAAAAAQAEIRKDSKSPDGYNALARALVRRGRETGNPDFYRQAAHAVDESFRLSPDNFEGNKARVQVLLGEHDYAGALDLARKLNQKIPDDVAVRGMVVDACLELGNYDEAETQAQWMLRLRRGNLAGMTRGALLRRDFGDVEGSIDWLTSVFKLTNATEFEERSWLMTWIARLRLESGKLDVADQILKQALGVFPDYYLTLDALAETRRAEGKYADAIDLYGRAQKLAPHPRRLFALAVTLKQASNPEEAARTFADFERQAQAISSKPDNANRELIYYYADYAAKPAEALRVAQAEIARRQDIETLDAYAWALYGNGQYTEAKTQLDKALKVGIREAKLFEHAARIAEKLKDQTAAAKYERQAQELRP